jgi:hypothetical protein
LGAIVCLPPTHPAPGPLARGRRPRTWRRTALLACGIAARTGGRPNDPYRLENDRTGGRSRVTGATTCYQPGQGVAGGATRVRRAGCVTMWRQGDVNAQNFRRSPGAAVIESPSHKTILLSSLWPPGRGGVALSGATTAGRVAVTTAVARSPYADPPPAGPWSGRPVATPALPAVDMTISRRSSK